MENLQSQRNESVPPVSSAPPMTGQQGQSFTTSFSPVNALPPRPNSGSLFPSFTSNPSLPGPSNRRAPSKPLDLFTKDELDLIAQAVQDQERDKALNNSNCKQ